MLRHLDYQDKVLRAVDAWIDALIKSKRERDALLKLRAERPEINIPDIDFSLEAWKQLAKADRLPRNVDMFSPRLSGAGEPVPNAILKVPTGGGKTLLAAQAVTRVLGRYLCKNTGFVLWIVPSEAIFSQTLNRLKDRQHPYRQILDRAAAGKVRILEKTDPLNARDVEEQLCVMLLMLPSANRQSQDQLKMFQDRGDVRGFFPPEGEQSAHLDLINKTPNLEHYGAHHF
jgi:type III restriction enzyme